MSKFDTQIQCEEITYTPTAADWAEYHKWLEAVEAAASSITREEQSHINACEQGHDWDDYDDPIDLYGAEYENHAIRAWD